MWPLETAPHILGVAALVLLVATSVAAAFTWLTLTTKQAPHEPCHRPEPEPAAPLQLYTPDEIKQRALSCGRAECAASSVASSSSPSCSHYRALLGYLEDFLAKPHADVGRAGPVCPFVPLALKRQTVLVGMVRTERVETDGVPFTVDDMVALMRGLRERFLQMEPTQGRLKLYKAMVIGFPDVADRDAPVFIDAVQRRLKAEFTQSGMMIGEFHRHNLTPGLRSATFRPLQTPVPALAIRFMVPTDVLFLKHDTAYLKSYLTAIPDSAANAPFRAEAQQAMQDLNRKVDGKAL